MDAPESKVLFTCLEKIAGRHDCRQLRTSQQEGAMNSETLTGKRGASSSTSGIRYIAFLSTAIFVAAAVFGWCGSANAQNEEWRRGLRAAQNAQFDAGNALDAARDCVAKERSRSEQLNASYRGEMANRQADLERDRTWREKLRSDQEALSLYDRNPSVAPTERQAYFKWTQGKTLRQSAGPKSTPQPILAALEELRRLQGKFNGPNRIRTELGQVTARLGACEKRIPALEEAFAKAREQYDAHMQEIVPTDNSDIDRLAALASDAARESQMCTMGCPTVDCADSARRLQSIVDAEVHLKDMARRLTLARADAHKHREALADQLRANSERRDSVDGILKAQEALVAAGGFVLDATSAVDGLKSAFFPDADDTTGMARKIDAIYETMKDVESSITAAANLLHSGEKLKGPLSNVENRFGESMEFKGQKVVSTIVGLGNELKTSDLKSRASDIRESAIETVKYFSEDAAKRGISLEKAAAMRFNLLQLVGSYARDYADSSIAEMQDRLRDIARSLEAETAVMIPAAEQLRRIEDRFSAAMNALYALQNARGLQQACAKACKDSKTPEPEMPDFTSTSAAAAAARGIAAGWGEALRYHNAQIPRLSNAILTTPIQVSGGICGHWHLRWASGGGPYRVEFVLGPALPGLAVGQNSTAYEGYNGSKAESLSANTKWPVRYHCVGEGNNYTCKVRLPPHSTCVKADDGWADITMRLEPAAPPDGQPKIDGEVNYTHTFHVNKCAWEPLDFAIPPQPFTLTANPNPASGN
jgi:hypothetical protein